MSTAFENSRIAAEITSSVAAVHQEGFAEIIRDRGIASAVVSYRPFKFGIAEDESPAHTYRKFFYNKDGRVVKKFDFNTNGGIDAREESVFHRVDKWKLLEKTIITEDDFFEENYTYETVNGKQKLKKYSFFNPRWTRPKEDVYEYDKYGRIYKKTSFGLMGEPELVTHYLYDSAKDTKVTYRHVTMPDDTLVITLLYVYDGKKQRQTGLYSFLLHPDEITALRNGGEDWESESLSRSIWEYDAHGNNTMFYRDEKYSHALDMLINAVETALPETSRILVTKSNSEYEKINGKFYLVRTTEWLTRFNEPLKAVKAYRYFDGSGAMIYPYQAG